MLVFRIFTAVTGKKQSAPSSVLQTSAERQDQNGLWEKDGGAGENLHINGQNTQTQHRKSQGRI